MSLVTLSLVTAAIISVYGILEHFGHSASCLLVTGSFDVSSWVQDVQNRVYATLGQPNWMAAYIVSLIFIPLSSITPFNPPLNLRGGNPKGGGDIKSIFNILIFIALFLALLFTKSRSGLLAFGISSLVFWWYAKSIKKFVIFSLTCLLLLFTITNPIRDMVFKPTVVVKPAGTALESGGTESGSIRKIVWLGATRIWTSNIKNFLIGTGPETFAQSYYQYRPTEHNQTSEWELLYNKAHNEFLNQLATTGILGFISYIILLFFMFCVLRDKALLAGWLTILVTNFWGFSVVITQLFLFLFPAIAIVLEQQSDKVPKKQEEINFVQIFSIFGVLSVTLLLCYFVTNYWYADMLFARGTNAIRSYSATQNPEYIVLAYQSHYESSKANPGEPAILSEFGLSASYLALAMRENATGSSQLAFQADKATLTAIDISPFHPNYYKNRARQ